MTLQDLSPEKTRLLLADTVRDIVAARLTDARPGHCLRISNLPEAVMRDLCNDMNTDHPDADVVLLLGPWQQPKASWEVSATRLIELRNAEQRPLLVFVPPGIKTAAEDSFDVSTFVEMDLGDVQIRLRWRLRAHLTEDLQW